MVADIEKIKKKKRRTQAEKELLDVYYEARYYGSFDNPFKKENNL